jgi:hypothetical protein
MLARVFGAFLGLSSALVNLGFADEPAWSAVRALGIIWGLLLLALCVFPRRILRRSKITTIGLMAICAAVLGIDIALFMEFARDYVGDSQALWYFSFVELIEIVVQIAVAREIYARVTVA